MRKALDLALRSNAVIAEWLQSPILYRAVPKAVEDLTAFCQAALTRIPVTWHYIRLIQRQQSGVEKAGEVRLKRYFYTLRPALALRWMRMHEAAMPPMAMEALMDGTDLPAGVRTYIEDLIEVKRDAGEMGMAAATNPECDTLIASEIAVAEDWLTQARKADRAPLRDRATEIHRHFTRLAGA